MKIENRNRFEESKRKDGIVLAPGWFSCGPQNERGVSVSDLLLLLDLDSEAGLLAWRSRPRSMFARDRDWLGFEARLAGKPAFLTPQKDGYLTGQVLGRRFFSHRVIFALSRGHWPGGLTDHENGVRTDNRPGNLRDVDATANAQNSRLSVRNTSGVRGVSYHGRYGKWQAQIGTPGPGSHLGYFSSFEAAVEARKVALGQRGYAPGHGRAQPG